jgi:signal transduction histidine kinase
LCRHDGGTLWVFSRGVPLPLAGGPVREWIGMMTDVSARKRVEETRERFIGVLGHDLRSPLTAIKLGAQTLERADDLPEHHASMVNLMTRCSNRMERMIADVLDFARGRLGDGIKLVCEPTNFGEVCGAAISELRLANPEHSITFESSDDLAGVWDPDRLAQTLTNLVSNAVVHGVGPIRVTAHADGDAVVLEVHNRGNPIPPEDMHLVFEPFRRSSNHGRGGGLGLGLYIVSEIVRAHGATISVRSTLEHGTTFSSRWPRQPPSAAGKGPADRPNN